MSNTFGMILGKEFAITSTGESCNPLDACEMNKKKINKKSALVSGPLAVPPAKLVQRQQ